jgi:competence protein ComEA
MVLLSPRVNAVYQTFTRRRRSAAMRTRTGLMSQASSDGDIELTVWHNEAMPRERWYVSGLILGVLVVCLAVLAIRWSLLADRVPLSPLPSTAAAQARQAAGDDQPDEAQPALPTAEGRRLDLNEASAADLMRLPGIGEVLAARIVEYRERCGPFRRVADLVEVEGIGESKMAAVEELVYVQPAE